MQSAPVVQTPNIPSIPGLKTRFLNPNEASNPGAATDLVLVVEPLEDASAEYLKAVFQEQHFFLL